MGFNLGLKGLICFHSLREVLCLSNRPRILKELFLVVCPSVGAIWGMHFRAAEWSSRMTCWSNVSTSSEKPNTKRTMNTRVHLVHKIGMAFTWLKSALWPRISKYSFVIQLRLLPFVFHALSLFWVSSFFSVPHWPAKKTFINLQVSASFHGES